MGAMLPEGLPGDFAVRLVASCPEAVCQSKRAWRGDPPQEPTLALGSVPVCSRL